MRPSRGNREPSRAAVARRSERHPDGHGDQLPGQPDVVPISPSAADSLGRLVQARLEVGTADDAAEVEAESIADAFVSGKRTAQRRMRAGDELRRSESESVSPSEMAEGGFTVSSDAERSIGSAGPGTSLPDSLQTSLGDFLGADLSGVRIHADRGAAELSRSLGAEAFTVGNDVFFGANAYDPGSRAGQHLIAHEVTHTVQQGAVRRTGVSRRLPEAGIGAPMLSGGSTGVIQRAPSSVSKGAERDGKKLALDELTARNADLASRLNAKRREVVQAREALDAARVADPLVQLSQAEVALREARNHLEVLTVELSDLPNPDMVRRAVTQQMIDEGKANVAKFEKELRTLEKKWFLFSSSRKTAEDTANADLNRAKSDLGFAESAMARQNSEKGKMTDAMTAKQGEVNAAQSDVTAKESSVKSLKDSQDVKDASSTLVASTLELGNRTKEESELNADLAAGQLHASALQAQISDLSRRIVEEAQTLDAVIDSVETISSAGAMGFSATVSQVDGWNEVNAGDDPSGGLDASGLAISGMVSAGINIFITFNDLRSIHNAEAHKSKSDYAKLGINMVADFTELSKTIITYQKTVDDATGGSVRAIPVLGAVVSGVSLILTIIDQVMPLWRSSSALNAEITKINNNPPVKEAELAALNSVLGRNSLNLAKAFYDCAMDITMIAGSIASGFPLAAPAGAAMVAGAAAMKVVGSVGKFAYDMYASNQAAKAEQTFAKKAELGDDDGAKQAYLDMLKASSHAAYRRVVGAQLASGQPNMEFLKGLGLSEAFVTSTTKRAKAEYESLDPTAKARPDAFESLTSIDWSVAMNLSAAMLAGGEARSYSERFDSFMASVSSIGSTLWSWFSTPAAPVAGPQDDVSMLRELAPLLNTLRSKWLLPYAKHKDTVPWTLFGTAVSNTAGVKKLKVQRYTQDVLGKWIATWVPWIDGQPTRDALLAQISTELARCFTESLLGAPDEVKMNGATMNRIKDVTVTRLRIEGGGLSYELNFSTTAPQPVSAVTP